MSNVVFHLVCTLTPFHTGDVSIPIFCKQSFPFRLAMAILSMGAAAANTGKGRATSCSLYGLLFSLHQLSYLNFPSSFIEYVQHTSLTILAARQSRAAEPGHHFSVDVTHAILYTLSSTCSHRQFTYSLPLITALL